MRDKGFAVVAAWLAVFSAGFTASGAETSASAFWGLVNQIGAVLVAVSSLGEGEAQRGAVWVAELDGSARHVLAVDPVYAHPVLGPDGGVIALRGADLVHIDAATGEVRLLAAAAGLRKLIGVAPDGTILALSNQGPLGRPTLISPRGEVTVLAEPASQDDRRKVAILNNESRAYAGGRSLIVDRSEHGFDVFLLADGHRRDLTACGEDDCGQPALSSDNRRLVYIRSAPPP